MFLKVASDAVPLISEIHFSFSILLADLIHMQNILLIVTMHMVLLLKGEEQKHRLNHRLDLLKKQRQEFSVVQDVIDKVLFLS